MRLVTWNCCGGFRKKSRHIASFRPDVLVVPEVESMDNVPLFVGEYQPAYRDRIGDPAYPRRKGIGVFSYTDTKLTPVDVADPMYSFRRYEARCGDLSFQVVGVWTAATRSRETTYKQAHEGLRRHADWIRQRPTVILGDFNNNASWGASWRELLDLTNPLGLESAYHLYFSERFGTETRPTHFHHGKEMSAFHLDYCFLPGAWVQNIKKVEVGTYNDWRNISDHVPLVVDLDL